MPTQSRANSASWSSGWRPRSSHSARLVALVLSMSTFTISRASIFSWFQWQKLEMTKVERRKIICSVTFHIIAITCVVWSLYVLIERTMEEIKLGNLEWPFWTKLVVVGIGFTGGLVFMYIQCKMYYQLCRRWRAYNRVIYVQNCPENIESSAKGSRPSLQLSASASRKNYQWFELWGTTRFLNNSFESFEKVWSGS